LACDAVDELYIFKKFGGGGSIQHFATLCLVGFEKKINFFSTRITFCIIANIIVQNSGTVKVICFDILTAGYSAICGTKDVYKLCRHKVGKGL